MYCLTIMREAWRTDGKGSKGSKLRILLHLWKKRQSTI